jgi:hypothetical protein
MCDAPKVDVPPSRGTRHVDENLTKYGDHPSAETDLRSTITEGTGDEMASITVPAYR